MSKVRFEGVNSCSGMIHSRWPTPHGANTLTLNSHFRAGHTRTSQLHPRDATRRVQLAAQIWRGVARRSDYRPSICTPISTQYEAYRAPHTRSSARFRFDSGKSVAQDVQPGSPRHASSSALSVRVLSRFTHRRQVCAVAWLVWLPCWCLQLRAFFRHNLSRQSLKQFAVTRGLQGSSSCQQLCIYIWASM
jgi:hypothetical protein